MQNEFDFIQEEILSHTKQIEYYKKCLQEEGEKIQSLIKRRSNFNKFEPGKLCWFWDAFDVNSKKIRPMIRPYHHTELGPRGEKHYSADLEGCSIGHGWKYCKLVSLSEIIGKIITS